MMLKLSFVLAATTGLLASSVLAVPVNIYERSLQFSGDELDVRSFVPEMYEYDERAFDNFEDDMYGRSNFDGRDTNLSARLDYESLDSRSLFGIVAKLGSKVVKSGAKSAVKETAKDIPSHVGSSSSHSNSQQSSHQVSRKPNPALQKEFKHFAAKLRKIEAKERKKALAQQKAQKH